MLVSHLVYGLRLAANIALPGLPVRIDSEVPDVHLWLRERGAIHATVPESIEDFYTSSGNSALEQPNLRVGVLPGSENFVFFYRDGARFAVERHGREVWADWPENYTLEDACTYLLGPVMGFVLRLRGLTCLHASAVAVGDWAIALAGFPGVGKSTTAAAFAHCGLPVLADDVVALTDREGHFFVEPGYPRLNLWPDSVRALFGSEEALPRITPTWDKRYMPLGQNGHRFASRPLPLGVIYILEGCDAALTAPVVEAVSGGEAFMALTANTYVNYLLDREMRGQEFDVLSCLVTRIPVRRVRPPANPSALLGLCQTIATDAEGLLGPQALAADSGR